jgi:hypothetical protein
MRRHSLVLTLTLLSTAALLTYIGRSALRAQEAPRRGATIKAVVELFTSQGCSSCPAADALLREYAKSPGVIALTLPVDYWDYLGWHDTLASSANSARQRAMARKRGDGMIFTPQMVVNGVKYVNGNRRAQLEAALAAESARTVWVPMTLVSAADKLHLDIGPLGEDADQSETDASVLMGAVLSHAEVSVRGGENGGRKLSYSNVVHQFHKVATWKRLALSLDVDRAAVMRREADGCVALLQEGGSGRILSASLLTKC